MKTKRFVLTGAAILVGTASWLLAQDKTASKPPVAPKPQLTAPSTNTVKKPTLPVIGYLESRGQVIVIKAGAKAPVYSVKTSDGKLLFEDLTAEQLRAQAPEIHSFIKSAVAVNTRTDASLRMR